MEKGKRKQERQSQKERRKEGKKENTERKGLKVQKVSRRGTWGMGGEWGDRDWDINIQATRLSLGVGSLFSMCGVFPRSGNQSRSKKTLTNLRVKSFASSITRCPPACALFSVCAQVARTGVDCDDGTPV